MSTSRSRDSAAFFTFPDVRYTSNSLISTSKYCDSRFSSLWRDAQNSRTACDWGCLAPTASSNVTIGEFEHLGDAFILFAQQPLQQLARFLQASRPHQRVAIRRKKRCVVL